MIESDREREDTDRAKKKQKENEREQVRASELLNVQRSQNNMLLERKAHAPMA